MLQAASILLRKYPNEFSLESLTERIIDLLKRFQNKSLGDTLFRVGCDLKQNLGPEDRLAGAIHAASVFNLPCDLIFCSLVGDCHFKGTDEAGNMFPLDIQFKAKYVNGIKEVMISIYGFDEVVDSGIIMESVALDDMLK